MTASRILAVVALATATIGCDQATKQAARTHLAGQPTRTYLGGMVRLQYAENAGAFLSFGAHWPPRVRLAVFTIGTAVVLSAVGFMSLSRRRTLLERCALGLLWAGGVSNLIDRVAHGRVVDFLNVGFGWLRTGIFNVADVAVMASILLLLLTRAGSRGAEDQGSSSATDNTDPGAASGAIV